jgi:hypothetical protein
MNSKARSSSVLEMEKTSKISLETKFALEKILE